MIPLMRNGCRSRSRRPVAPQTRNRVLRVRKKGVAQEGVMRIAERSRKHNIGLRVNDREWKLIQRKVRLSGLTLREFFLRCVCGKDIIVKPGGREVVVELKRLGNNLNQITYLAKAGRIYDCAQELQHIYAEVREVRRAWQ